jgi:hypothetical protein
MRTIVTDPLLGTISLLVLTVVLAGCAGMTKLTPAQERTYAAWEACRGSTATYQLTHVNPDGSARFLGRPHELQHLQDCMVRQGFRFQGGSY